MTNDYSTLAVCTTHPALVGTYRDKEHRCPCDPGGEGRRDREWAGDWLVKEGNEDVHLCASDDFHRLHVRRKSLKEMYADCALTATCLDPALNSENDASGRKSGGNR